LSNKSLKINKEWFKNDLSRETIEQLFKSSMNHQEFLVYYSALRPPTSSNIPFFEEWIQEKKYAMPIPIKCKVVCDGIFIYPKKLSFTMDFNRYTRIR